MKSVAGICILLLSLFCFQAMYGNNSVKAADKEDSEKKILQGEQPTDRSSSDNTIRTGDIQESKIVINQGNLSLSNSPAATPWWNRFITEIIVGIIVLFFTLFGLYLKSRLKRRLGDTHE